VVMEGEIERRNPNPVSGFSIDGCHVTYSREQPQSEEL